REPEPTGRTERAGVVDRRGSKLGRGPRPNAMGNADEYRSPMATPLADVAGPRRSGQPPNRGSFRNGKYVSADGVYRSPSFQNDRDAWMTGAGRGRRGGGPSPGTEARQPVHPGNRETALDALPCDLCGAPVPIERAPEEGDVLCDACG